MTKPLPYFLVDLDEAQKEYPEADLSHLVQIAREMKLEREEEQRIINKDW